MTPNSSKYLQIAQNCSKLRQIAINGSKYLWTSLNMVQIVFQAIASTSWFYSIDGSDSSDICDSIDMKTFSPKNFFLPTNLFFTQKKN